MKKALIECFFYLIFRNKTQVYCVFLNIFRKGIFIIIYICGRV